MDLEDRLIAVVVGLIAVLVAAMFIAFGVWAWRNADDNRDCRRAGGVVTDTEHEWHCVGATPEAR